MFGIRDLQFKNSVSACDEQRDRLPCVP